MVKAAVGKGQICHGAEAGLNLQCFPLGRIGDAFSRLTDNLAEGTANLIEFIGYSLPFLIVLFPVALGLRKLWRRLASR